MSLLALPLTVSALLAPGCDPYSEATTTVRPDADVVLGPMVIIGARKTAGRDPDAFGRRGYKLPVTLENGATVTLSVPRASRGRAGLVYTPRAQDRAWRRGVAGAEAEVRFAACAARAQPARTGWPGGIVVDRPRCVTLEVRVAGGPTVRRRVPLGRAC